MYASTAFYRRLLRVPRWQELSVTQAAQAVQLSAFPGAYAQHEAEARVLARVLTGEVPIGLDCQGPTKPSGLRQEPLVEAADRELGAGRLTEAKTVKARRLVEAWLVAHAKQYGVRRIAGEERRWTAQSGRWVGAPAGPVTYR